MVDSVTPIPIVRAANEGDALELARLLTLLGHPMAPEGVGTRWKGWRSAGNAALVVEKADGTLAGAVTLHQMIVLHRPKPVGRITSLVVDDSVRGRGIGRALVAAAEEALASRGCGLLEITSNASLPEAHTFYAHLGYEQTSLRFAKVLVPVQPET